MLSALILLTLGVDDELVCWDYEQTELGLTRTPRTAPRPDVRLKKISHTWG